MRLEVPDVIEPADRIGRVHFVGIGGAGLSAIARLMAQQGIAVSGSDASDSAVLRALVAEGIDARVGHAAEHLDGVDTVIASTAVREDNPEIVEARRRGLRLWPRSAGLQSVLLDKYVVAIAGTHGKTTTTAMTVVALREAGLDPTFAIGAEVESLGTNARLGTGAVAVVEADESDGAFLVYTPRIAVVTNVDADHLDYWGTEEAYTEAFERFAADPLSIAEDRSIGDVTVGFGDGADIRGHDLRVEGATTRFRVTAHGQDLGEVSLAVPGRHYAHDALYALAVGLELDADPAALIRGLAAHRGAKRRMEFLGEAGGVRVYDSYAHHPTEISADLAAARAVAGADRLVVAYQPHLVSRTRVHGREMGRALSAADRVIVADLYLAREDPDPDVTSALVVDAVDGPTATAGGPVDRLHTVLLDELRAGDMLLTLGAGDITTVGPRVLEGLAGE